MRLCQKLLAWLSGDGVGFLIKRSRVQTSVNTDSQNNFIVLGAGVREAHRTGEGGRRV